MLTPVPGPAWTVTTHHDDGGESIDFPDGGTLHIPADTVENRVRARATRACHLCPDVNQGCHAQDARPDAAVPAVVVTFQECGHVLAYRLDDEQAPPRALSLFRPPPDACCILGQVYFDAYARAARAVGRDPFNEQAAGLTVSQLVEVVDHLVTSHDAGGRTSDQCAGCVRFAGEPQPGMTQHVWDVERRAHEVAHTVIDGGGLVLNG